MRRTDLTKASLWDRATKRKTPSKVYEGLSLKCIQALLDVYALVLVTLNALSKPRSAHQSLYKILEGDGMAFLLVRLPSV